MARISPSLASAPFLALADTVRALQEGGADLLHFDLEDGVFVPMMTLGTRIIRELRPLTNLPFDVHLMMVNPEWLIPQLVLDGANRIAVHYEACPYPRRVLREIGDQGAQAGLAFNPATPLPDLAYLRPYLHFVVLLTTEPEGSGCPFLPEVLDKLRAGRARPELEGVEWVVDGGIQLENVSQVVAAGADVLVVGRSTFQNNDILTNLAALRRSF